MVANAHQDDGREGPAEVNTHRQHNNILRTLPKVRPSVPIKLDHVFFPSFLLSQKEHYQETQENNLFLALNELYTTPTQFNFLSFGSLLKCFSLYNLRHFTYWRTTKKSLVLTWQLQVSQGRITGRSGDQDPSSLNIIMEWVSEQKQNFYWVEHSTVEWKKRN